MCTQARIPAFGDRLSQYAVGIFPETEEMPGAWFGLAENEPLRPAGASRTNFCQVGPPEVTLGLALRTASHTGPDKSVYQDLSGLG
jgi:hypothetical protein